MMRQMVIIFFVITLSISGIVYAISRLTDSRARLRNNEETGLIIPTSVAKIVSFEYRGLLSDIIFFRVMTFYGGKIMHEEPMRDDDWEWFRRNAELATDLDPYFFDPYYLGSINLAWYAGKVGEANELLKKALQARTWDWTIPFYLGFNYFYFYNDNENASRYLMEAARRPGGSGGLVPTLAARLAHLGGKTETAIIFLEDILRKTDNKQMQYVYNLRLNALKKVFYLEQASERYRTIFGRLPVHLDELVKQGIIKNIPSDPYGGTFYITANGNIKTTSNFIMQQKR